MQTRGLWARINLNKITHTRFATSIFDTLKMGELEAWRLHILSARAWSAYGREKNCQYIFFWITLHTLRKYAWAHYRTVFFAFIYLKYTSLDLRIRNFNKWILCLFTLNLYETLFVFGWWPRDRHDEITCGIDSDSKCFGNAFNHAVDRRHPMWKV